MSMERPKTMDVSDIAGARPRRLHMRRSSGENFAVTSDISYAQSRHTGSPPPMHRYKSNTTARTAYAVHTQVCSHKFLETGRRTDPLDPNYALPSYKMEPPPAFSQPARDLLWTIPKSDWRPSERNQMDWSDVESKSKELLLRNSLASRDILKHDDIVRPQFAIEAASDFHRRKNSRVTNPLEPRCLFPCTFTAALPPCSPQHHTNTTDTPLAVVVRATPLSASLTFRLQFRCRYIYDGGPTSQVASRIPKYGCRYPRKPEEDFGLKSADITDKAFGGNVPSSRLEIAAVINQSLRCSASVRPPISLRREFVALSRHGCTRRH